MSLTGHHMPPRTTQQSHRPRVSDRTMVGTLPPRCLQALRHGTKNAATDGPGYRATPRSTTEPTRPDVRHLPSPSPCGRGEVFSLDIPFYRTRRKYLFYDGDSEQRNFMPQKVTMLGVFASCPKDLSAELNVLEKVIEELNPRLRDAYSVELRLITSGNLVVR